MKTNLLQLGAIAVTMMVLGLIDGPYTFTGVVDAKVSTEKKDVHVFHQVYSPHHHEKEFNEHLDEWDPNTKIRKVVDRKKVLRKVKKIKGHKTINEAKAKKLNGYLPEKLYKDVEKAKSE